MKVIILVFILTISGINSFQVKQIKGVVGDVLDILFDSQNNVYLYASGPEVQDPDKIYKLDSQYNIVFTKEVKKDSNCSLILNNKDEMYAICASEIPDHFADINILRTNSSEFEKIKSIDFSMKLIFGDDDGNLMYSGFDPGLFFLKYNMTEPVMVRNTEVLEVDGKNILPDSEGNTYLAGRDVISQENRFLVIPADSKKETPEAFLIEGLLDNPDVDYVNWIKVMSNDVLISIENGPRNGRLKKISNNNLTTIYSDEAYYQYATYSGKTRTLIVAYDYFHVNTRITSLGFDGKSIEVSNPIYGPSPWYEGRCGISVDDEGNAFIYWVNLQEPRSHLDFLNSTDTTTVEVDLGNKKVFDIVFDGNNNLWINTHSDVFFLRRGSLKLELVPYSRDFLSMWTNKNKESSEMFTKTGLEFYVISN